MENGKIDRQSLKSSVNSLKAAVKSVTEHSIDKSSDTADYLMDEIVQILEQLMNMFIEFGSTLTVTDRSRLISAGIKNLGFIQVTFGSASANPSLVPPYLNMVRFQESVSDMNRKRMLLSLVQQFAQNISDGQLIDSDAAYRYALEYYNYVREAARQRVPGAETEYLRLKQYFKRARLKKEGAEPTEAQIERDVRSLMHGKKEGRIVIENENPFISGGKRTVSDSIHSNRSSRNETSGIRTIE